MEVEIQFRRSGARRKAGILGILPFDTLMVRMTAEICNSGSSSDNGCNHDMGSIHDNGKQSR
jgi:hypothetical protein